MSIRSDGAGSPGAEQWDRIARQLSAAPRRSILVSLAKAPGDGEIPVMDAVKPSAVGIPPGRLEVQLQHHHLPMLEDVGYVTWLEDPFIVQRGPNFEEVEAVLEVLFAAADELPPTLVHECKALENDGSTA